MLSFDGVILAGTSSENALLSTLFSPGVTALAMASMVVALGFIGFSRERDEDEFIAKLRGDSLIWAVMVNCVIVALASLCLYDLSFLYMVFVNIYLLLILFILKFRIKLNQVRKNYNDEE